jgi:hypothetical protein
MISVLFVARSRDLLVAVSFKLVMPLMLRRSYVHSKLVKLFHVLIHKMDFEGDRCRVLV